MTWKHDHKWSECTDLKGGGHDLLEGVMPAFAWRYYEKSRKISSMMAVVRTGYLPNTKLERYCHSNPLANTGH